LRVWRWDGVVERTDSNPRERPFSILFNMRELEDEVLFKNEAEAKRGDPQKTKALLVLVFATATLWMKKDWRF
jgi:hypothetical protein